MHLNECMIRPRRPEVKAWIDEEYQPMEKPILPRVAEWESTSEPRDVPMGGVGGAPQYYQICKKNWSKVSHAARELATVVL